MRLLFAGTPTVAVGALHALVNSPAHEVLGVLTRPDAPAGRRRQLEASPVARYAAQAGLEIWRPRTASDPDFLHRMTDLGMQCAAVVAYGGMIREPALGLLSQGWVNLHFSLLPAWRGAAPVQHAILRGDDLTGATTFQIGPGLDDGPVYGVVTEPIRAADTSGELLARLAVSGAGLLTATMDGIAEGSLIPRPQATEGVSWAPKLASEDARLDFGQPALAVDRRARACTPAPGAWAKFRGDRLKLFPLQPERMSAALSRSSGRLAPGELAARAGGVFVGTSTTELRLGDVQPAGRTRMPAEQWARGVRLEPGDQLGD